MFDPNVSHEDLEKIKNNLQASRGWLHSTFEQPYTVEEMTKTLAYYLNAHLYYYSNLPGLMAEKQQRIFKIQRRLEAAFYKQTENFRASLATEKNPKAETEAEIARCEHPFRYHMQGRYCKFSGDNKSFEVAIPHVIDMLAERHSPYFEFVFDDNLELINPQVFDFFTEVLYLQFLRQELAGKNKVAAMPMYDSFEGVFKDKHDCQRVMEYLKSVFVLDSEGVYIETSRNKKYLAVLPQVLRAKSRLKVISDKEAARLMKAQFNLHSLSTDYLSKNFKGRDELAEEMLKDLRL